MECKRYDTLTLMSYFTGDVTGTRRMEIENHLTTCPQCAEVIASLALERDAFLNDMPVWTGGETASQTTAKRVTFPSVFYAMAASLILAVGMATFMTDTIPGTSRIKGEEAIHLYRADTTAGNIVRDAGVLYTGERIQFTYSSSRRRYFVLAGIDGTGRVSLYYPVADSNSMILEPGSNVPLPNSIELDDFVGREQFVAVFSDKPLSIDKVTSSLQHAFTVAADFSAMNVSIHGADCHSVSIFKRERP